MAQLGSSTIKTSLGNVLHVDASSTNSPRDSSSAQGTLKPAPPKLHQSVRAAIQDNKSTGGRGALNSQTISSIERTQADQAGYTVIRRRTLGSISKRWPHDHNTTTVGAESKSTSRALPKSKSQGHHPSSTTTECLEDPWVHVAPRTIAVAKPRSDEERWLAAASIGDVVTSNRPPQVDNEASTKPPLHEDSSGTPTEADLAQWLERTLDLNESG